MFPFADTNPTKRWELVTFAIVALNVLAFLWFQTLPPDRQQRVVLERGFIPARIEQLSNPQKVVEVEVAREVRLVNGRPQEQRQVERLPANTQQILASTVTCMFLHGGWLHLIGNMWFLLLFGNNVEDRLGHLLFAIFYLLGGLAATVTHWAIDPTSASPVIGASGAVAAVLGAYAVKFPRARIRTLIFLFVIVTVVELPAYFFLAIWFGIQLLEGVGALQIPLDAGAGGGVAWWAHIGGFVFGAVMMPLFSLIAPAYDETLPGEERDREPDTWPPRYEDRW